MERELQVYRVMLAFVIRLFNLFYDNNILLLQLKYHLNDQQMNEVKPVYHCHATVQWISSPCGDPTSRRRIGGGTSRTEKGFINVLQFAAFRAIPPLFHVHILIYLSLTARNSSNVQCC